MAPQPEVLVNEGKAHLVNPETGARVAVDASDAQALVDLGFRPATYNEYAENKEYEHYNTLGSQLAATAAGAGRGLTFGLSDLALRNFGVAPETLTALQEYNPKLSAGGEIAGAIGSSFIPGGVFAQGGKLGAAAARGTARALATSAETALPRLAGGLVREGTIGAAFGAGQSIGELARSPNDLSIEQMAGKIARDTLVGAGIGAGFGAAGFGVSELAKRARSNVTFGISELKGLRTERDALGAELSGLRAANAPADHILTLERQFSNVEQMLKEKQADTVQRVLTRTVAFGIGTVVGGGLTGGLISAVAAPAVLRGIKKALTPLAKRAGEAATSLGEKIHVNVPEITERVGSYFPAKTDLFSKVADYVGPKLSQASKWAGEQLDTLGQSAKSAGEVTRDSANSALMSGVGSLASMMPEEVVAGAMLGGLHGAAAGAVLHVARAPVRQLGDLILTKVAPAGRIAAIDAMQQKDLHFFGEEVRAVDPALVDAALRMSFPEGMPRELADAAAERTVNAVAYLQSIAPRGNEQLVPTGARQQASEIARAKYARSVQAVIKPDTMMQSFVDGKLTQEQVAAWQAVYPEALQQLRDMVSAEVRRVKATGGVYDYRRANQIATLLGDKSLAPKIYDPQAVAGLQALYQSGDERRQAPRARKVDIASSHRTTMQRLGSA